MIAIVPLYAVLILLLCHSWFGPDIWYHLTWGRSLVEHLSFVPDTMPLFAQPIFANMYWLFQVTMYEVFSAGGTIAVSIFFMLLWLAISAFWMAQTKAYRLSVLGPFFFLGFIICAQMRFEPRPEILSYLYLSVMVFMFSRWDIREEWSLGRWIAIFLLQVLWTSCHGYFALGPCLALAILVGHFWDRGRSSRKTRLRIAGLILLLFVGTLISPFGWNVWSAVAAYAEVSKALRETNQELFSPRFLPFFWPMAIFWLMWLTTTVWSFARLWRREKSWVPMISLAGSALALQAIRNIPLFLILSSPALGEVLVWLESHIPKRPLVRRVSQGIAGLIALGTGLAIITGHFHKNISSLGTFGIHLENSAYPIGATEYLDRVKFQGKLFNDSYDGGYLEFHLPSLKIVGDSYFSDSKMTLQYFSAIRVPQSFRTFDQKFQFDAALINVENLDIIDSLWVDPLWKMVYADSHRALFVRRASNPSLNLDIARTQFYKGEDLTHWTYTFGVVTWAGIALHYQDLELEKKIMSDLAMADQVPSTAVRYGLSLAINSGNRDLAGLALALASHTFESGEGDARKISELADKIPK